MADSSSAQGKPSLFFNTQRVLLLLCLVALVLYLKHSGQAETMARSLWAELQFGKALEQLREGNVAEAAERLESASEASPKHHMHLRVGMLYSLAGMQKRALPHFLRAVAHYPKDANAYYHLGDCLLKMERLSEAVAAFQHALAIPPDDPVLLNDIGYSYAEEGIRLQEAEQLIRRALAMRPKDGLILDSLGWVYFKQGRLMEALAYLEKARRLSPDNAEIAAHLIEVRQRVYSEQLPLSTD